MDSQIANQIKLFYTAAVELWPILLENWKLPEHHLINMGKIAAFAVFDDNKLFFNPLHYHGNEKDFLFESVGHEISHLIAFKLYGDKAVIRPHGKEWRYVMVVLGIPPKIKHNYCAPNSVETEGFICACGGEGCGICKKEVA